MLCNLHINIEMNEWLTQQLLEEDVEVYAILGAISDI